MLAFSSLRTLPNNHLEFQDKIPNKKNSSFVEDANQSNIKSEVIVYTSLSTLSNNHLEFQDKIPNELK